MRIAQNGYSGRVFPGIQLYDVPDSLIGNPFLFTATDMNWIPPGVKLHPNKPVLDITRFINPFERGGCNIRGKKAVINRMKNSNLSIGCLWIIPSQHRVKIPADIVFISRSNALFPGFNNFFRTSRPGDCMEANSKTNKGMT